MDKELVYHGSHLYHDRAIPTRHRRSRKIGDGTSKIIFDEVSFHATPHKWIAVAYTYTPAEYSLDGRIAHYNMGVDLYDYEKKIEVYGFESLGNSLKALFGNGGYVSTFRAEDFERLDGLGNFELATLQELPAVAVEEIKDPVAFLESEGVVFEYIDLAKPENESIRNYEL